MEDQSASLQQTQGPELQFAQFHEICRNLDNHFLRTLNGSHECCYCEQLLCLDPDSGGTIGTAADLKGRPVGQWRHPWMPPPLLARSRCAISFGHHNRAKWVGVQSVLLFSVDELFHLATFHL
ncbi:Uncharacterized protein Adt_11609 [Abeliophyllum distichum]|uniref:Uncharacterized protein n=1 Tax=Abeliophyllum distichum TaxID=126358 RepID=A0ABD1UNJ4_9LAMI